MADGRAYGSAITENYETVHVIVLDLNPGALVAHVGRMICGRIKPARHNHIARGDPCLDVIHLHQLCSKGMQLQKYPVQVRWVVAGDGDLHITGVVLLLTYLKVLDLELAAHVHDLVENTGHHLRVDEMSLHLNICNLAHKLGLHHISPSSSAWVLSFVLMTSFVIPIR